MTDSMVLNANSKCWPRHKNMIELSPSVELLADEKRPSLCSLSLTGSICSSSSIDLVMLEQCDGPSSLNHSRFESTPLENNFFEEPSKSVQNISHRTAPEPESNTSKTFDDKFRKCISLHDVSNIEPLQLTKSLTNTVSCETVNSQSQSSTTKSKDSGFQRSVSCLSLTSGRRNYNHIESKVKAYIKNIKDSEALRKKNKLLQKAEITCESPSVIDEVDLVVDKEELLLQIQELKQELQDKALYIDAQRRNYNKLLLKLAEAKNTIDSLRVQKYSLNYGNHSKPQNRSSGVSFSSFEQETNESKNSPSPKNTDKIKPKEDKVKVKEQLSIEAETPYNSSVELFEPKKHSTPQDKNESNKSLSPVSKMFSSSSRLDKNYKPLADLPKQNLLRRSSQSINKKESGKNSLQQKQSAAPIDVPNDDPFDKVKKWQASLPSINLLGSHSSSDCDGSETEVAGKKDKVSDMDCSLSTELINKCKISNKTVDKHYSSKELQNISNSNNSVLSNQNRDNINIHPQKKQVNVSLFQNTVFHNELRESNGNSPKINEKVTKSESRCKNGERGEPNLKTLKDSSDSDEDSLTNFPKSCLNRSLNRYVGSNSSDDSSSMSSAVLHSNTSSVGSPSKSSKRRSSINELGHFNKVPKFRLNKSTQTSIVLREPKLSFTVPSVTETFKTSNKTAHSHKSNINNFVGFRSKIESSQRRAWNARNNVNFHVSKEFSFKRSSSLQECIEAMEGMIETGSSIIESALDRSLRI